METIVANKMIALIDRFESMGKLAARDLFDVHQFFFKGFSYKKEIILARRGASLAHFLNALIEFIEKHVTQTVIDQDLNFLLPVSDLHKIRKILKQETLMFLRSELVRVS